MPTMSQGFKRGRGTSPNMKTVFHSWLYGRYIEIQSNLKTSKKLHRTNQGSNFLGGSFSNRDNVRVPIQFRRDSSILKADPLFFTSIAPALLDRSVKISWVFPDWNQQATSCLSPQCLIDQIKVQKPILVVVTDQMPDHI